MARSIWPKIVGKSTDCYIEEATIPLAKAGFGSKLQSYAGAMQLEQNLDPKVIDVLFKITSDFLQQRAAVSAMKKAHIEKDWRRRKRLLAFVKRDLAAVRNRTRRALRAKDSPLTFVLAQSVHHKLDLLMRELDDVATFQRLQESMFNTLRQSTKGEKSCIYMLNKYLEDRFAGLPRGQRDIIIAGALIASGIPRTKDFDTIVCPARPEGFEKAFLGQHAWWAIRIAEQNIPRIKFIAIYQSQPISAITHYGEVDRIEPYTGEDEEAGKYKLFLKGEPVVLPKPVTLGKNVHLKPQGPKYATLGDILKARTLDDVFYGS